MYRQLVPMDVNLIILFRSRCHLVVGAMVGGAPTAVAVVEVVIEDHTEVLEEVLMIAVGEEAVDTHPITMTRDTIAAVEADTILAVTELMTLIRSHIDL